MDTLKTNILYFGDNLEILQNRDYFPNECVDLIYLDPPFNSKKDYNILFKENGGVESEAQIKAFTDTWEWGPSVERAYRDFILHAPLKLSKLIQGMVDGEEDEGDGWIGRNDVTAYLVMMAPRLREMYRVLKDTGSLYLHCDPTASHYLKLVLDQIFGPTKFQNEIVWWYHDPSGKTTNRFMRKHDVIFFYAKGSQPHYFDIDAVRTPYKQGTLEQGRRGTISFGRITRTHPLGRAPEDVWEIPIINSMAKERLGYPTQKPLALLERIIKANSKEGDIILDPFCGCGTALVAAQKLNRRWIGIDITHLAIRVMSKRLKDSFHGIQFEVIGEPVDLAGARALAHQDRYQFQWWALSLIEAQPLGEKKKGADKGIDGVITFPDERPTRAKRAAVQVKSGHVHVKDIRELKDIASRHAMGIFITLEPPTREMQTEAMSAGYYHSPLWERDYPKIQILTIEELLAGKTIDTPPADAPFPKAQKIAQEEGEQLSME